MKRKTLKIKISDTEEVELELDENGCAPLLKDDLVSYYCSRLNRFTSFGCICCTSRNAFNLTSLEQGNK